MESDAMPSPANSAIGRVTQTEAGDLRIEVRLPRAEAVPEASPQILLTVAEAANELRVSRATMFRLLGTEIPRTRVGGTVRVARAELESYVLRNTEQWRSGRRSA